MTDPCTNCNDDLPKPPLKLEQGWVIRSNYLHVYDIVSCSNADASLVNFNYQRGPRDMILTSIYVCYKTSREQCGEDMNRCLTFITLEQLRVLGQHWYNAANPLQSRVYFSALIWICNDRDIVCSGIVLKKKMALLCRAYVKKLCNVKSFNTVEANMWQRMEPSLVKIRSCHLTAHSHYPESQTNAGPFSIGPLRTNLN